jgi:simple sugar transport system ATP-binding protein
VDETSKEEMSEMMVGRKISFKTDKKESVPGDIVLKVRDLTVSSKGHANKAVKNVSFDVRRGEIVCIAGIDGNGQSELVYGLAGLAPIDKGQIYINDKDVTKLNVRHRNMSGLAHIPEDRHKDGLVLDFNLSQNLILKKYFMPEFQKKSFIQFNSINEYGQKLMEKFDIRSGQGLKTPLRSMSGGNQQKAIVAREIDLDPEILIAVQPTRGLDVGAIEYIHKQLVNIRDEGKAVLLISLELDEVMNVSDRILVIFEGEIVANVKPEEVTIQELGLYMAGSKRNEVVI